MAYFRDELRAIPDLVERAHRLLEIEDEAASELKQIKLRLARDMNRRGMSLRQIGDAFGVSRARAHQMVHHRTGATKVSAPAA